MIKQDKTTAQQEEALFEHAGLIKNIPTEMPHRPKTIILSKKADQYISDLHEHTGLDKAPIAKLAFSLSMAKDGPSVPESHNKEGGEISAHCFLQDDMLIYSLACHVYGKVLNREQMYSEPSIVKNHIDTGAAELWEMFEENTRDVDSFYCTLSEFANHGIDEIDDMIKSDLEMFRGHLSIPVGSSIPGGNPVSMDISDSLKHTNAHVAIVGTSGVGKTQLLLKMLSGIRSQSNRKVNFIFLDYKGDVSANDKFAESTGAEIYRLQQQENPTLPINPFVLSDYDEKSIKIAAQEKLETFAIIGDRLGSKQRGALKDAIVRAYALAREAHPERPYPDFRELADIALMDQSGHNNLTEAVEQLANYDIFWSHESTEKPIDCLSGKTMIVDLSGLSVCRELPPFLLIEKLYKEMRLLPESPFDDYKRTLRTILVIDEAHHYLGAKNRFLQEIIREGRSKGIYVFLASQSPKDYYQQGFDYRELLEFVYVFQCQTAKKSSIQELLGCSAGTAKNLQTQIANLNPFEVITKSFDDGREFQKIKTELAFV